MELHRCDFLIRSNKIQPVGIAKGRIQTKLNLVPYITFLHLSYQLGSE